MGHTTVWADGTFLSSGTTSSLGHLVLKGARETEEHHITCYLHDFSVSAVVEEVLLSLVKVVTVCQSVLELKHKSSRVKVKTTQVEWPISEYFIVYN